MAVVARCLLVGHLLGADLVQALGATEAGKGVPLGDQLVRILLVDLAALALPVWAMRATDVRTLVPLDTQPAQRIVDLLFGLTGRAQLISILDAQDELAAVLTGEAQVEQRDIGGADVRITGRRWRDAGANRGHGSSRTKMEKRKSKGRMLAGTPRQAPAERLRSARHGTPHTGRSQARAWGLGRKPHTCSNSSRSL